MIENRFDPSAREGDIYAKWEGADAFKPQGEGEPFSIVIPPPNVTGVLHIGHALNNTLQDVLARFNRMQGKRVLWQPGTDHAGIATQMVVERQLAEAGGNESRASLGREAFIERVWEWKEQSGGQIMQQLRRLGASCDWSREKFTMGEKGVEDDQMVAAVTKVFVDLYNDGLIYRDKRLVNWDPHFQTAISDLEVENREVKGHMWHFKYPLAGGETYTYVEKDEDGNVVLEEERDYISIATTRPETMLGDGAVAVHPSDERYAPIVGKLCEIPVGPKELRRLIPIIQDEYPDPGFGSGAVKITGAHDLNDYGVAQRNKIPMYRLMDVKAAMRSDGNSYEESAKIAAKIAANPNNVFEILQREWLIPEDTELGDREAKISAAIGYLNLVPDEYRGLDRFKAREKVVADIDAEGLMIAVEDKKIMQPFGDRSGVVIEPMLTNQWYVDAKTLAKPAIKAVEDGSTRFVPATWEKTYFEWMRNIEPWCVSRQLWWGHRIPAWYGPEITEEEDLDSPTGKSKSLSYGSGTGNCFVASSAAEAAKLAEEFYGTHVIVARDQHDLQGKVLEDRSGAVVIYRDEDVLDTWFSSGLWPFSTMGWPGGDDPALKEFYPTSVLVTAFDIIFFWVARMMMQGLHFMGEVPFKDVYIHALVRDEKGQKMSKSKGNVIDPLELVDEYGADALRMTLTAMAAQGRDIKLSKQRVEGYRNFSTKLWNAFRFSQMNECVRTADFDPKAVKHTLNKWIIAEVAKATAETAKGIEQYRFNEAAGAAYRFTWNVFCDWYLELVKPLFSGEDEAAKAETRATAAWVIEQMLHMLHPFMPFVTEELFDTLQADAGVAEGERRLLIVQRWPELDGLSDAAAEAEVDWVIRLISAVRSARQDVNVPAGAKVPLALVGASDETKGRLETYRALIERLARVEDVTFVDAAPKGTIQVVIDEATACLSVADLIDLGAEKARLAKEIGKLDGEITGLEKRLGNPQFVEKAPPEVVEEQKERVASAGETKAKLAAALTQLEAAG